MVQNTVQSSYSRYASAGVAGAFADMTDWDADTRICESTAIGFGLAVSQGAADEGALLGGSSFAGISIRDITLVHDTADQYETGDNMAVATRGDIWVKVGTDVSVHHEAYYNSSTGAIGASSIANAVAIAGSKFLDTVSSGGFARVRLSSSTGHVTT